LSGLSAVLAWYGPYDAHETNSIVKASLAMLEDRAPRFRIRVCARIFCKRPVGFFMKAVRERKRKYWLRGLEANWTLVLCADAGDRDRFLLQPPQMNCTTSSKARMSRHQAAKYEAKAVH
jgi:uncharacterized protein (DUF2236 family)